MRFLVDADLGHAVSRFLTERGHDAVRAAAILPPRSPDPAVARAVILETRHVITGDRNFVWQTVRAGAAFPHAVIDLRPPEPAYPADFVVYLRRVMDEQTIEDGFHYIVEPARICVARIPCP